MTRVFLVDHFEAARYGLRQALQQCPPFKVMGEGASLAQMMGNIQASKPDLVICEVMFPEGSAVRYVRSLLKHQPHLKVVFLTTQELAPHRLEAQRCGAYALLSKKEPLAANLASVTKVCHGSKLFSDHIDPTLTYYPTLSNREEDVICCLVRGMKVRELAHYLGVSQKTIEAHKTNIMKKLDLHSQVALVRWAIGQGLILP